MDCGSVKWIVGVWRELWESGVNCECGVNRGSVECGVNRWSVERTVGECGVWSELYEHLKETKSNCLYSFCMVSTFTHARTLN